MSLVPLFVLAGKLPKGTLRADALLYGSGFTGRAQAWRIGPLQDAQAQAQLWWSIAQLGLQHVATSLDHAFHELLLAAAALLQGAAQDS